MFASGLLIEAHAAAGPDRRRRCRTGVQRDKRRSTPLLPDPPDQPTGVAGMYSSGEPGPIGSPNISHSANSTDQPMAKTTE